MTRHGCTSWLTRITVTNMPQANLRQIDALSYEPHPHVSGWKRSRRLFRLSTIIISVITMLLLCPTLIKQLTVLYWQRRCLAFDVESRTVVYEGDATRADAFANTCYRPNIVDTGTMNPRARHVLCWDALCDNVLFLNKQTGILVFLHSMRSNNDQAELLAISFEGRDGATLVFSYWRIKPIGLMEKMSPRGGTFVLSLSPKDASLPIRILAGHVDQNDSSHITIPIFVGPSEHVLNCWMGPKKEIKAQLR
jgi:hypothetical protein